MREISIDYQTSILVLSHKCGGGSFCLSSWHCSHQSSTAVWRECSFHTGLAGGVPRLLMCRYWGGVVVFLQVLHMVKNSKLVGQSIIAYLQQKGYPEVSGWGFCGCGYWSQGFTLRTCYDSTGGVPRWI